VVLTDPRPPGAGFANAVAAPIRITSLQLADANVIIRFETVAGFTYVLEHTDALNGNCCI